MKDIYMRVLCRMFRRFCCSCFVHLCVWVVCCLVDTRPICYARTKLLLMYTMLFWCGTKNEPTKNGRESERKNDTHKKAYSRQTYAISVITVCWVPSWSKPFSQSIFDRISVFDYEFIGKCMHFWRYSHFKCVKNTHLFIVRKKEVAISLQFRNWKRND